MNTEQLHSHISYTLDIDDRLSDLGLKTMQTRPIRNCIVPGKLTMNGDVRLLETMNTDYTTGNES